MDPAEEYAAAHLDAILEAIRDFAGRGPEAESRQRLAMLQCLRDAHRAGARASEARIARYQRALLAQRSHIARLRAAQQTPVASPAADEET